VQGTLTVNASVDAGTGQVTLLSAKGQTYGAAGDITTGGSTAAGDRIVVAVLETDGSNFNHTDLIGNHWVNIHETPDNGLDDDGNGYVDDYNGWNTTAGTDNVAGGGHGTSVSGMIGATGDNGLGGVGVNWDVEIMQIDIANGLTESNVLAGYEYARAMRALYNDTDGAKGAVIVVTNASWGSDSADPADFPVWCGFYDALGEEGVLNCGATTNSPLNVDVQGDMPTACASDFMISVTATDDNGCSATAGPKVFAIAKCYVVPNAFTPNGDSTNDSFGVFVSGGEVELVELRVYNRWGQQVFESSASVKFWDGRVDNIDAPSDVYVYVMRLRFPDGREELLKGDLTLLR
jgi:gliding motility-associated-like protein